MIENHELKVKELNDQNVSLIENNKELKIKITDLNNELDIASYKIYSFDAKINIYEDAIYNLKQKTLLLDNVKKENNCLVKNLENIKEYQNEISNKFDSEIKKFKQ